MSSTRPKLRLDEQSFQGLLAAAFTIQEYNDRKDRDPNLPILLVDRPTPKQAVECCKHCGAPFPDTAGPCPRCGLEKFRPGERLQRNWASMYLMSQGQSLMREPTAADALPSPKRNGNGHKSAVSGLTPVPPTSKAKPKTVVRIKEATEKEVPETVGPADPFLDTAFARDSALDSPARTEDFSEAAEDFETAAPSAALAVAKDSVLADHGIAETAEATPSTISGRLWDLRVKLLFHRADFYLTLAILVAAAALLWPSATAQGPTLPAWERLLIAMGVAEAPSAPVHYRGDPDIKVWVDTHTALYYCPGDELFGKSSDGHFTTQREAQSDRFEPAQSSACIQ